MQALSLAQIRELYVDYSGDSNGTYTAAHPPLLVILVRSPHNLVLIVSIAFAADIGGRLFCN